MRVVSLFAGIGGIDLGLEAAGHTTVAQVENNPYCVEVLERHWPDVPRFEDITQLDPKELPAHDIIAGGFPCQPVSLAGLRLAQDDPRWLWPHMARIIRGTRPRYVVVENVPGLFTAGFGDVLSDLAAFGYDAEWQSIPAAAVGAPHHRRRLFVVAYSQSVRRDWQWRVGPAETSVEPTRCRGEYRRTWPAKSRPFGVAYGVPRRVDRLRALGNAVVPQVAEVIGHLLNDLDATVTT